MKVIYLQRLTLWLASLTFTLIKFWIKNPQETLSILRFIQEKITVSPRFFSRNIFIENHRLGFEKKLLQTKKLYSKYGKSFNPKDPKNFKVLEKILPDKVQILYFLIRKIIPGVIIETGVAAGESTGFILQALDDNKIGKLYSIDLPFQWYIYGKHKLHMDSLPAGKKPGYLVPEKLKGNWQLILGNSKDNLPRILKKLGKIDIFFHDSEHNYKSMIFEYTRSWPYIKKGGLLLSDDISYTEAFNNFSKTKGGKKAFFKDLGILVKTKE